MITFSLLAFSCTKHAEYKREKNAAFVRIVDPSVSSVKNISWRVGKYGKEKVSRGFRMYFELPKLSDEAWKSLYENEAINGWLIRLRRKNNLRNEVMGYYAVEMISPKPESKSIYRIQGTKEASLGVYYAASSISSRLDHLPCPAFDHRFWLDDIEVTDRPVGERLWVTNPVDEITMRPKVTVISYSAVTINGGMSLKGEYYIDLALYNTFTKKKKTSLIELANHVSVQKEEERVIKGCENYVVPDKGDQDPIKKFKFGN